MNYELAKKLKDAGYPPTGSLRFFARLPEEEAKEINKGVVVIEADSRDHRIGISAPTLSELIEACGEQFAELSKYKIQENIIYWRSSGGKSTDLTKNDRWDFEYEQEANTPEEAVAKLWLALNKK